MEDLIILVMLLSSSFCFFVQSTSSNDNSVGEPLDVILREHAFNALLSQQQRYKTGTSYEVKLPANLSGMNVSYIRFRSTTLWRKGANFSNFQIPSRTLPMPFVKRVFILYQDFGNLSSRFYENMVPGYTLVSSVVGFRVYDASNPATTNARKIDLNTSDHAPISVHFAGLKFPRGAKCASFGGSKGEYAYSLGDMSVGHVCHTKSDGQLSVVIPKRKKRGVWVRWGVVAGVVTLFFVGFVGVVVVKIAKAKRLDEVETRTEEGSVDLETVWIGYSKMPCATVTRTNPNLESPSLKT